MKCGFCGYEFKVEEAAESCAACPIARGCHLIRCPRCGYEMPRESKLITSLRHWLHKPIADRTSGLISQEEQHAD